MRNVISEMCGSTEEGIFGMNVEDGILETCVITGKFMAAVTGAYETDGDTGNLGADGVIGMFVVHDVIGILGS